jgi:hypothetical protein
MIVIYFFTAKGAKGRERRLGLGAWVGGLGWGLGLGAEVQLIFGPVVGYLLLM